jgi:hypothetical protein
MNPIKLNPLAEIGYERLIKTLHIVYKCGQLTNRQLAAHVIPDNDKSGLSMMQKITLKAVAKGLLIAKADENKVLHFFIGLKGARLLKEEGYDIALKSGKDQKISSHRSACNDYALFLMARGLPGREVYTDADVANNQDKIRRLPFLGFKRMGDKLPDTLMILDLKAYWVEVENSRRNEKELTKLCFWLKRFSCGHKHDMGLYETKAGTVMLAKVLFVCTHKTARGIAQRIQDWLVDDHTDEATIRLISSRLIFVFWPDEAFVSELPSMRVLSDSDFKERLARVKLI